MLYQCDLECLGIHPDDYPAKTINNFYTANGIIANRCYELHVEVLDEKWSSLVDPDGPIHPQFPPKCGAVVPVAMVQNSAYSADTDAGERSHDAAGDRLSSILPLLATYVSSTPGNNILFGEERNDVLGFAKMPPARRWIYGATQQPRGRETWSTLWDPLITFTHRNGKFIDRDLRKGVETATVYPGTAREHQEISDPGNRLNQQAASGTSPQSISGIRRDHFTGSWRVGH